MDKGPFQRERPHLALDAESAKSPAERGFSRCAEEDSNLHPVIPDQALNPIREVSLVSKPR